MASMNRVNSTLLRSSGMRKMLMRVVNIPLPCHNQPGRDCPDSGRKAIPPPPGPKRRSPANRLGKSMRLSAQFLLTAVEFAPPERGSRLLLGLVLFRLVLFRFCFSVRLGLRGLFALGGGF